MMSICNIYLNFQQHCDHKFISFDVLNVYFSILKEYKNIILHDLCHNILNTRLTTVNSETVFQFEVQGSEKIFSNLLALCPVIKHGVFSTTCCNIALDLDFILFYVTYYLSITFWQLNNNLLRTGSSVNKIPLFNGMFQTRMRDRVLYLKPEVYM